MSSDSIDLRVEADENSCRQAAEQLKEFADGLHQHGTCFHRARTESEQVWRGQAADAFRDGARPAGQRTDEIIDHAHKASRSLHSLADDVGTVKSRMEQARQVAAEAGLTVDGNLIHAPQASATPGGPTPAPAPPDTLGTATGENSQQQQAFRDAQQTVGDARQLERAVHSRTQDQMKVFQLALDAIRNDTVWSIAAKATGAVGTALAEADKWSEVAEDKKAKVTRWQALADKASDPYKEAQFTRRANELGNDANNATRSMNTNERAAAGLRDTKLGRAVAANPGSLAEDGSTLAKIGGKIPYLGAGITTATYLKDGSKSGEWGKSAVKDFGGFAAATVTTDGALAGAAALGLAGGPVTLGAVALGFGAAYGVGEVVDHWGDIKHGVSDAGKSVSHLAGKIF